LLFISFAAFFSAAFIFFIDEALRMDLSKGSSCSSSSLQGMGMEMGIVRDKEQKKEENNRNKASERSVARITVAASYEAVCSDRH
jgi:hypothetical protein